MIFSLHIFFVILFASPTFAGWALSCGNFDRPNNESLITLVLMHDLNNNRQMPRSQCGLPGENFPVCSSCETSTSEDMMKVLRPLIGQPNHLQWHAGWHQSRMSIEFLQSREGLSGEDFLYMHRLMIKMVQFYLADAGQPCMAPWTELPGSVQDIEWPVPKKFSDKVQLVTAEKELKSLRDLHAQWRNPVRLKKVSLDQLGRAIESGLHQSLHHFYRGNPLCSAEGRAQGYCDDLIPTQTSPLNKYFWKIHGLVDELVGLWLKANGYEEISSQCESREKCYQWKGTWIGDYPRD